MGFFDFFKKKNKSEEIEETQSTDSAAANEIAAEEEKSMNDSVEETEEAVREVQEKAEEKEDSVPVQEEEAGSASAEEKAAEASAPQAAQNPVKQALTPEQQEELKKKREEEEQKREEEGKVLSFLIDRHNDQRSGESLQTCIKALSTSWLWVPMRVQMSNEDAEAIRSAGKGVKVRPKNPVKLRPELLKNKEGKVFMPTFATKEEVPEDMRKRFVWVRMPSGQCGLYVLQNQQVGALIINPFSKGLVLQRELLSKILRPANPVQEEIRPDAITS